MQFSSVDMSTVKVLHYLQHWLRERSGLSLPLANFYYPPPLWSFPCCHDICTDVMALDGNQRTIPLPITGRCPLLMHSSITEFLEFGVFSQKKNYVDVWQLTFTTNSIKFASKFQFVYIFRLHFYRKTFSHLISYPPLFYLPCSPLPGGGHHFSPPHIHIGSLTCQHLICMLLNCCCLFIQSCLSPLSYFHHDYQTEWRKPN